MSSALNKDIWRDLYFPPPKPFTIDPFQQCLFCSAFRTGVVECVCVCALIFPTH